MEDLHPYIFLLALAWILFNKYAVPKMKNLPPTPFSALKVIGNLFFFKQPIHQTLSQIADRHGPIMLLRFGCRRVLLISSSSAAEELFSKNDLIFAHRPKLLPAKVFGCNYSNLAWAPHGGHWKHLRRVTFLEILRFHRLTDQHESMADQVKLLVRKIFHTEENTVELRPLFLGFVFDVMMRMFAGKRYCQQNLTVDREMEYKSLLDYATDSFRMATDEPDISYFMPILKKLGEGLKKKCKKLQKEGDFLMDGLIEELRTRMADFAQRPDEKRNVLESLLGRQENNLELYNDKIIKGLVQVLTSAGTDTSAGTLEWALSLLLRKPEVLKKAHKEIENYVGNVRFLDESDIEHLPYLRCIVKETLRMYPAAPLLVPHHSSKECMVGGYTVPKGTMLMVNVWAIQNNPKIWENPKDFNPERFEKIVGEKDGFNLMPFGYGRRSCPGKYIAIRMISLALGSLIQCFEWEPQKVDMTEKTGLALLKTLPLKAVCRPRSAMVNLLSQI